MSTPTPNWFADGGDQYARYRPAYPVSLVRELAALAPSTATAVDVGCGNGQLTTLLAGHFDRVIGVDPSRDQIAHATARDRVEYRIGPAERLPVDDGIADLVTVAQAAHWFDLPAFYDQVRRIAVPGAVIALLAYGEPVLPRPELNERFLRFSRREIGRYWPPEIAYIQQSYRTIPFPFPEVELTAVDIEVRMTLPDLLGYLSTWSAVRAAAAGGRQHLLRDFATDLGTLWEEPAMPIRVVMPVHLRVGQVR